MDNKKISWEEIVKLDDCLITYFLYREGKSIKAISKIRNIHKEIVEKDIVEAKIKLRMLRMSNKGKKKSLLDKMLEVSKEERLRFINEELDEIENLKKEIKLRYKDFTNPDDKMILIWIIGELKDKELINIIAKDIINKNGNIRRMVCSALGKIGDKKAVPFLNKALKDKKPQVRQYAAKALKNIGNENTVKMLIQIINNKAEKKYVKKACIEALKSIKEFN
ncbi:HEAT repeat domain-containing protein [Caminicella sporogenes]|uniref:HEAT repeat domain-containing protein n=1 Tax=Caminicella sporogenes TaxID=166485 RepID=UPI00254116D1|nr:HEAT repeat domain-containing protein [Caminicella sporogenes]WIF94342.1 HEAT repeat domain-containing protein [Caminicella sporogenes]